MFSALAEYFSGFGDWNWLILAIILFVLETIIPGVHFLWFGVAAVLTAIVAFATDLSWQWEVLVFALLSLITVFGVRHFADPYATQDTDEPALNVRGDQYIGREVSVENEISGGRGRVRVGDTIWAAEGPDAPAGTRVKITAVKGTVFQVEPL